MLMKRIYILWSVVVLIVIVMLLPKPTMSPPPIVATNVALDENTQYQTIDGWEVTLRYWGDDKTGDRFDRSFEAYTEEVSQFLVNTVGINRVRVPLWSGLENPKDYWPAYYQGRVGYKEYSASRYEKVNDNDDPNVADLSAFQFSKFDHRIETMLLPLKRALEARNEKLFVNVNYTDFSWGGKMRQGSLSHAHHPEEFAEFVLVFLKRLRDKYGIEADAFEVILEPENTKHWHGPQIGRGLVAVAKRLKENGFNIEIIAPSTTAMANANKYFEIMIKEPDVLSYLDTFAYHRYKQESIPLVKGIRATAKKYHLKTAMLEKIGAGIDQLLEDLTVGQVSSWQQWAAAKPQGLFDRGAYYALVNVKKEKPPRVAMAKLSYQLSQVFLYVRRGAVRIAAKNDHADNISVAFINPDGSRVVVVRAKQSGGPVSIKNLPKGQYNWRFIDDQQKIKRGVTKNILPGQELQLKMPSSGVLTVYSKAK